MAPTVKVFISYAREDENTACELFSWLESIPDVEPWLDVKCLLPGTEWETEIQSALNTSDIVIVILSSAAIAKTGYIQKEIRNVLDQQEFRPPGEIYCIPARLDSCSPKHPELKKLQWVDLFPGREKGLGLIRRVIDQRRKRNLGLIQQYLPPTEGRRRVTGTLITFTWHPEGSVFVIRDGPNYIGSGTVGDKPGSPLCDILIPDDDRLSSKHALVQFTGDRCDIIDWASSNGTYLNGELIPPLHGIELPNYARIITGSTMWQFVKYSVP